LFLDKQGSYVPIDHIRGVLSEICVPLAGRCILRLQMQDATSSSSNDALMIEFELCIGLLFKPLRHHVTELLQPHAENLSAVWKSILSVLEEMLGDRSGDEGARTVPARLQQTMQELTNEHLQNAIMVLISAGALLDDTSGDLSSLTWESVKRMGVSTGSVNEWKQQAAASSTGASTEPV
jgi:hypothetical protein